MSKRLAGTPQLRPGLGDRPGRGLDTHLTKAVTAPGPGIFGQRHASIPVAAKELSNLGFERGLHQQLRAEPGHLLQDLRQLASGDRRLAVRDSKDPAGPKLVFTPSDWTAFVETAKSDKFDL